MTKLFTLDRTKDLKLIDQIFILKGIGEAGIDLRGKFTNIDSEGYYIFKITTHNTIYDEYLTRAPNDGEITQ